MRTRLICLLFAGCVVSVAAEHDEAELKKRMEIAKKEWMDRRKANEEVVKEAISSKRFDVLLDALKPGCVSHETYFRILEVLPGSGYTERLIEVLKQHNQMLRRGGIEAMNGLAETRWTLMKVIAADLGMNLADSDGYIEFLKKGTSTLEEDNLAWDRAILTSNAFIVEASELARKKQDDLESESKSGENQVGGASVLPKGRLNNSDGQDKISDGLAVAGSLSNKTDVEAKGLMLMLLLGALVVAVVIGLGWKKHSKRRSS